MPNEVQRGLLTYRHAASDTAIKNAKSTEKPYKMRDEKVCTCWFILMAANTFDMITALTVSAKP
jgi:hypothetical protein